MSEKEVIPTKTEILTDFNAIRQKYEALKDNPIGEDRVKSKFGIMPVDRIEVITTYEKLGDPNEFAPTGSFGLNLKDLFGDFLQYKRETMTMPNGQKFPAWIYHYNDPNLPKLKCTIRYQEAIVLYDLSPNEEEGEIRILVAELTDRIMRAFKDAKSAFNKFWTNISYTCFSRNHIKDMIKYNEYTKSEGSSLQRSNFGISSLKMVRNDFSIRKLISFSEEFREKNEARIEVKKLPPLAYSKVDILKKMNFISEEFKLAFNKNDDIKDNDFLEESSLKVTIYPEAIRLVLGYKELEDVREYEPRGSFADNLINNFNGKVRFVQKIEPTPMGDLPNRFLVFEDKDLPRLNVRIGYSKTFINYALTENESTYEIEKVIADVVNKLMLSYNEAKKSEDAFSIEVSYEAYDRNAIRRLIPLYDIEEIDPFPNSYIEDFKYMDELEKKNVSKTIKNFIFDENNRGANKVSITLKNIGELKSSGLNIERRLELTKEEFLFAFTEK